VGVISADEGIHDDGEEAAPAEQVVSQDEVDRRIEERAKRCSIVVYCRLRGVAGCSWMGGGDGEV